MKFLFVISIFIFSYSVFPQTGNEKSRRDFDKILSEQSKFITDCKRKTTEAQIREFGKVLPKISGECEWGNNGCPIKLLKPVYPETPKRYRISSVVKVETIIDETGKVVFAKAFNGKKIFYRNAERAASLSLFYPKTVCGKTVYQRKIISYNFLPL